MKKIFSLVIVLNLTVSTAFAVVKEDVVALGKLSMGYSVSSVKGTNATQIFQKFTGEELIYKEIDKMIFEDEVNEGFTSVRSAKKMGEFALAIFDQAIEGFSESDDAESQRLLKIYKAKKIALQKNWSPLIQKISDQGAKFGYTGWGPGYCGVRFIELIIIDAKAQKVYEVKLSEGGDC